MTTIIRASTLLALALLSGTAAAAPKDELHDAFAKFFKLHSFRASVTDLKKNEPVSTMEFVAPDRYRMQTKDGHVQYIIGDALYMEMDGKLTRLPVPGVGKMTAQFRNEGFLKEVEGDMAVQALPDESVDGQPTKVYAYTITKPIKADAKTFISTRNGMPLQTESSGSFMGMKSTTRVRYSDFDDPAIRIDAPN